MFSTKELTKLYTTLYSDLVSLASVAGVTEGELQKYFIPNGGTTSENILFHLCSSLQNSGMMRNSIKFNDTTTAPAYRKAIENVMCGFDAKAAAARYNNNWEDIYQAINERISDRGSGEKKETNWQKYCRGLYDGLVFLNNQFFDYQNGERAIEQFKLKTELTDNELKLINIISNRIHGLGFSLTCDWLKECGCLWLAKPDVHINSVIMRLEGVNKIKNDEVLRVMFSWAEDVKNSGVDSSATAYKLDKIIWLLCTGEFYLDNKRIGRDAIYNKMYGLFPTP